MMYILTEEEYQNLGNPSSGIQAAVQFVSHFAYFECTECGRLVAMEKSKKDSAKDLESLAQGCPGCGENVIPFSGSGEQLVKRVLG